jgi:signal transduction histidine kinase
LKPYVANPAVAGHAFPQEWAETRKPLDFLAILLTSSSIVAIVGPAGSGVIAVSALSKLTSALRFDRHSLRWKLPWLFALTASLTVATFGFFAYVSARALAFETATTRLRSTLSQVRTVAELGIVNQLTALRNAAHDPEITASLNRGSVSDSAARVLQSLKGLSDSTVVVELRNTAESVLKVIPEVGGPSRVHPGNGAPADAAISRFQEHDGAVSFVASIAVQGGRGALGSIRVTRQQRLGVNRRMAANQLEGSVLLVGNVDGPMWGPAGAVQYPVSPPSTAVRYLRNGERWLSVAARIPNTPWLYALDLPARLLLAPANALIIPFVVIGILIAIAGAFVGGRVSRRITMPLANLTIAAESLARGERDVPLTAIDREDEIGRLARAFNSMTSSVTSARSQLEAEIDTRTGELSTAAARLHALHDELRESEKLASLGRLSGSVGHELRNPLGVMSNVIFLIDNSPEASDKLREYARLLREQIRVSDRIISDLLDRARSGPPVRTAVDVIDLLDEIVQRAGIPPTIKVERRSAVPIPRLVLDRDHLAQILWNLTTNAVQAMQSRNGVLTIAGGYSAGLLRIEIQDSGDGIPGKDADRIFEPMFTTKAHGIGLGLSVSRAFARANGGDLFVKPTKVGACFVLEMPAVVEGEEEPDAVHSAVRARESTDHDIS